MNEPFFFARDNSCHWYMVPERTRSVWDAWSELDEDDEESWEAPEGAVLVNGPLSQIVVQLANGGQNG